MALKGVKVLELAGLAPAPFCGMVLADFGASVIRIDRTRSALNFDTLCRGKRSISLDLQRDESIEIMKTMCKTSDVVIEPFRPGIMEKLGLGPKVLQQVNPRLIYARLSGFGQNGPFSKMAGHDINYVALSGVLSMLAPRDSKPLPPVNLLADFAGGGLLCAFGVCLALLERVHSGKGQIIDVSMTEGAAYVGSFLWKTQNSENGPPLWGNPPARNVLDGGAPFYQTYATKDGKHVAVGALEPKFYTQLLKGLELDENKYSQFGNWDEAETIFAERFVTKTRKEWAEIFKDKDACVTPVLGLQEAARHEHARQRKSFFEDQTPRPAPQLSRTPAKPLLREPQVGEHTQEILQEYGYSEQDINSLISKGVVEIFTSSKL